MCGTIAEICFLRLWTLGASAFLGLRDVGMAILFLRKNEKDQGAKSM
jgi:hypothetical protein